MYIPWGIKLYRVCAMGNAMGYATGWCSMRHAPVFDEVHRRPYLHHEVAHETTHRINAVIVNPMKRPVVHP